MACNSERQKDSVLGYTILRVALGLNIAIHGLSRVLAGPANFANSLIPMFQKTFLPAPLVYFYGLCLPWAEGIVGGLLLVGIWTRSMIVIGALTMLSLTFGATIREDWESAGLQLIYIAVYSTLATFRTYNQLSADELFGGNSGGH